MKDMNPERWRAVRRMFDELIELDPVERQARLARLRSADADLRAVVESLLEADATADAELSRMEFGVPSLMPAAGGSASKPGLDPLRLTGRTLSHFRVHEAIAAGGMGVVYRAEDTLMNRPVALKFPLPHLQMDEAVKERLVREARAAGALDHANVCSIHEVGESSEGHVFLAMALYPGETLKALLARAGRLPVEQALAIARQIADGLACAHAAGVVHRDLKPGNLMVLPDGTVKILDFGLAKATDLSHTSTGMVGTAAYMAPEQIHSHEADHRTDLWALGVVLYEMVTGQRPFASDSELSITHAVVYDEPPAPSQLRTDLPVALEKLILNLLQKQPAQRYASAQAVCSDLAAVERGEVPTFGGSLRSRSRTWFLMHRRRVRTAQTALAIVVLAFGAIAAQRLWAGMDRPPTRNAQAYEYFRRAQEYQRRVWNVNDWNEEWWQAAETLYRRAIAEDPGFAHARAALADVLATRQFDRRYRSSEGLEQFRREAEAALELDPRLGEAHLVMSWYWGLRGDKQRALEALKLAHKGSPRNAEVLDNLSGVYEDFGRFDDAVAASRRAAKLEPKRALTLAAVYTRLRRHEEAAHAWDRYLAHTPDDYAASLSKAYVFLRWRGTTDSLSAALRRLPKDWDPGGVATRARVALALAERRPAEALAALAASRHTMHVSVTFYEPAALGRAAAYDLAGDSAAAAAEYERARQILTDTMAVRGDDPNLHIALAQAFAGLGRRDEALLAARQAAAIPPAAHEKMVRWSIMARTARMFTMLREYSAACSLIERLLQDPRAGFYATPALLRVQPAWDPLRDTPCFQQILARWP